MDALLPPPTLNDILYLVADNGYAAEVLSGCQSRRVERREIAPYGCSSGLATTITNHG